MILLWRLIAYTFQETHSMRSAAALQLAWGVGVNPAALREWRYFELGAEMQQWYWNSSRVRLD